MITDPQDVRHLKIPWDVNKFTLHALANSVTGVNVVAWIPLTSGT